MLVNEQTVCGEERHCRPYSRLDHQASTPLRSCLILHTDQSANQSVPHAYPRTHPPCPFPATPTPSQPPTPPTWSRAGPPLTAFLSLPLTVLKQPEGRCEHLSQLSAPLCSEASPCGPIGQRRKPVFTVAHKALYDFGPITSLIPIPPSSHPASATLGSGVLLKHINSDRSYLRAFALVVPPTQMLPPTCLHGCLPPLGLSSSVTFPVRPCLQFHPASPLPPPVNTPHPPPCFIFSSSHSYTISDSFVLVTPFPPSECQPHKDRTGPEGVS